MKKIFPFLLLAILSKETLYSQNDSTISQKTSLQHTDSVDVEISYGDKRNRETVTGAYVLDVADIKKQSDQNDFSVFKGTYPGSYIRISDLNNTMKIYPNYYNSKLISEPLYIVDGVPYYSINFLSTEDIKQITIVNDGVYTALYGARAKKGVVLISTKKDTTQNKIRKFQIEANSNLYLDLHMNKVLNTFFSNDRYSLSSGFTFNKFADSKLIRFATHLNSKINIVRRKERNILSIGENIYFNSYNINSKGLGLYIEENYPRSKNIFGNVYLEYNPFTSLTVRSSLNCNYTYGYSVLNMEYEYNDFYIYLPLLKTNYNNEQELTLTNTVIYKPNIQQNHNLTILLGQEYRNLINAPYNWNSSDKYMYKLYPQYASSERMGVVYYKNDSISINSYFGQLSYILKNKYLMDVVFRGDNARIGNLDQWTYLPAISAGWILSKENFWQKNTSLFCKLWTSWKQYDLDYWESKQSVTATNIGIDLRSTNNMFQTSFWWNNKQTDAKRGISNKELLTNTLNSELNALNAMLSYSKNTGSFKYSAKGTFTYNHFDYSAANNIYSTEYYSPDYIYGLYIDNNDPVFDDWDEINSYKQELLRNANYYEPIDNSLSDEFISYVDSLSPGDSKIVDSNKDGYINKKDYILLGKTIPDYILGLELNCSYKGVFLKIVGQGTIGGYKLNQYNHSLAQSNLDIENATYFKISYISIGYDFSHIQNLKSNFNEFKVYASVSNLLTKTDYSGYEPEGDTTTYEYWDYNFADDSLYRSIMFGCSIKF